MKAIARTTYGSPDVLHLSDVDTPELAADQVRVRVHAASINQGDVLATRGWPYLARLMEYALRKPRQEILGSDLAGRVEAVGSDVKRLRPGDHVFGWARGAFAQFAVAPESGLVIKPTNITFEQAAAVPTAAVAALQAIRDKGQTEAGQQVLIIGASGGVGTFAVQIAKAFGAEVTGVSSTNNVDLVRSTGADHVIDYTREDFTYAAQRYDLIIDLVGNQPLRAGRRALRPAGTFVVVGGQNPHSMTGMRRFAKAALMSPFVSQRFRPLFSTPNHDDLVTLKNLLETGRILPVIDRSHDLTDVPEAIRHLETGHARGKLVIKTDSTSAQPPRPSSSRANP